MNICICIDLHTAGIKQKHQLILLKKTDNIKSLAVMTIVEIAFYGFSFG